MRKYLKQKFIVVNDHYATFTNKLYRSVDCARLVKRKWRPYSMGFRGRWFTNQYDFERCLTEKGSCNWFLFPVNDDGIQKLKKHLGWENDLFANHEYFEQFIKDYVKKTRAGYWSDDPEAERKAKIYIEIEDIFK